MDMLWLLARDSDSVALLPRVVVQDELRNGQHEKYCVVPQLNENFYAITVRRHFEPPLLKTILKIPEAYVLEAGMVSSSVKAGSARKVKSRAKPD